MADAIKIQLQDIYEPITEEQIRSSKNYVLRREKAASALATLVDALLEDAAGEITRICYRYGVNPTTFTISGAYNVKMMEEVAKVMDKLEEDILTLISDYSTICTEDKEKKNLLLLWVLALGRNNQGLRQSLEQRLRVFLKDIEAMIAVAKTAKFDISKALILIKGNLHTVYQMPGMTAAFQNASLYEAEFIRSRGVKAGNRGSSNSEANNILRFAKMTLQMAWMHSLQQKFEEEGAAGYVCLRGSSYPCSICDEVCGVFYPIESQFPLPVHPNCACYAVPVYEKDIQLLMQ